MKDSDRERLDKLRGIVLVMLDTMADSIIHVNARVRVLVSILESRGLMTDAEVTAKAQALVDADTLEREYGEAFAKFREMRRLMMEDIGGTETDPKTE